MNDTDGTQHGENQDAIEARVGDRSAGETEPVVQRVASEGATEGPRERAHVTPKDWVFLSVIALVAAALDLWSKAWAVRRLSVASRFAVPLCSPPPGYPHYLYQRQPTDPLVYIQNYLDLSYAENCGGAWGLLHGTREGLRKPFFMLVTLGAVLFILHLYRSLEPQQKAMRWALPLVLGGAIGNLVDRIRLGYVVDFIHAHWKDKFHWPTFNVADIAITVGIGLMVLEFLVGPRKKPVAKAKLKTAALE